MFERYERVFRAFDDTGVCYSLAGSDWAALVGRVLPRPELRLAINSSDASLAVTALVGAGLLVTEALPGIWIARDATDGLLEVELHLLPRDGFERLQSTADVVAVGSREVRATRTDLPHLDAIRRGRAVHFATSTTTSERIAWLEEALAFAAQTGALQRELDRRDAEAQAAWAGR